MTPERIAAIKGRVHKTWGNPRDGLAYTDFIKHCIDDVPDLLAALESAQAEVARLREALIDVGGTDAAGDNPCWCDGGPEHTPECRQASSAISEGPS